jgi:hypothetical protein
MRVVLLAQVVELFNGRDLSGWYGWLVDAKREDPRKVYSVVDGTIRISGDGFGYLATEKPWSDYRLSAEFRWGERNWRGRERHARDAGLFLHGTGPDGNSHDGNGAFMAAVECQVMQGRTGDLMLIRGDGVVPRLRGEAAPARDAEGWPTWMKGGAPAALERVGRLNWFGVDPAWKDVLDVRGPRDVESPGREWTKLEVTCAKDRISVRVNGTLVNEAYDIRPSTGKILLQCEGSEIFWRGLRLQELKD